MQLLSAGNEVNVWHFHSFSCTTSQRVCHLSEGVSGGLFDWMATDHDLQLHRADPAEFLW